MCGRSVNNNGCLECLTGTGPKCIHILEMYTFQDAMHARTHTHTTAKSQQDHIMGSGDSSVPG